MLNSEINYHKVTTPCHDSINPINLLSFRYLQSQFKVDAEKNKKILDTFKVYKKKTLLELTLKSLLNVKCLLSSCNKMQNILGTWKG